MKHVVVQQMRIYQKREREHKKVQAEIRDQDEYFQQTNNQARKKEIETQYGYNRQTD